MSGPKSSSRKKKNSTTPDPMAYLDEPYEFDLVFDGSLPAPPKNKNTHWTAQEDCALLYGKLSGWNDERIELAVSYVHEKGGYDLVRTIKSCDTHNRLRWQSKEGREIDEEGLIGAYGGFAYTIEKFFKLIKEKVDTNFPSGFVLKKRHIDKITAVYDEQLE